MQLKNQKGIVLLTIVLIIVGFLVLGGTSWYFYNQKNNTSQNSEAKNKELQEKNLTEEQRKQLEIVKQRFVEANMIGNINQLQMSLDFYFKQNGVLPASLNELYPKFIADKKIVENEKYLYAYSYDRKTLTYHLGIKLEAENQPILKNDKDFNSISAGYINGFDGADPVYDVVLNNNIMQAAERDKARVGKIRTLINAVQIYQDSHEGALPSSINFLGSILPPDIFSSLQGKDYFYAISKDKKNFHAGVKLELPDSYELKTDDDFNSLEAGYANGFNGKDPIYDKTY